MEEEDGGREESRDTVVAASQAPLSLWDADAASLVSTIVVVAASPSPFCVGGGAVLAALLLLPLAGAAALRFLLGAAGFLDATFFVSLDDLGSAFLVLAGAFLVAPFLVVVVVDLAAAAGLAVTGAAAVVVSVDDGTFVVASSAPSSDVLAVVDGSAVDWDAAVDVPCRRRNSRKASAL